MKRPRRSALLLPVLVCGLLGAQQPAAEASPAAQFEAIKAEYQKAMQKYDDAAQAAKTPDERKAALELRPDTAAYVAKVKPLVAQDPTSPFAVEAIAWTLEQGRGDATTDELLDILLQHHLESEAIANACRTLQYSRTPRTQEFLRAVIAKCALHAAQGWARYVLAKSLQSDAGTVRRYKAGADPRTFERLAAWRGKEAVEKLLAQDPDALGKEAEDLLDFVAANFADVKTRRSSLAKVAENDLFELRYLEVGKVVPDIEGKDIDGVAFKLSDYRGKVIFLDFWGYW